MDEPKFIAELLHVLKTSNCDFDTAKSKADLIFELQRGVIDDVIKKLVDIDGKIAHAHLHNLRTYDTQINDMASLDLVIQEDDETVFTNSKVELCKLYDNINTPFDALESLHKEKHAIIKTLIKEKMKYVQMKTLIVFYFAS
jgi:hypothetical protein